MKRINAIGFSFCTLISLSACTPLDQAPLVYASTRHMGVNISGGTPENTGVTVDIGFRENNVAYVPVAVGGNCPAESQQDCDGANYQLMPVSGADDGQNGPNEAQIRDLRDQIGENDARRAELIRQNTEDENLKTRRSELRAEKERLEGQTDQPSQDRGLEIDQELARATDSAIETRMSNRQHALTTLSDELNSFNSKLDQVSRSSLRHDSYSVFGSFNGNASAQRDHPSLVVGSVFSTGVAAQTLTRGLEGAAVLQARTNCIQALRVSTQFAGTDPAQNGAAGNSQRPVDTMTDAQRATFWETVRQVCGGGQAAP